MLNLVGGKKTSWTIWKSVGVIIPIYDGTKKRFHTTKQKIHLIPKKFQHPQFYACNPSSLPAWRKTPPVDEFLNIGFIHPSYVMFRGRWSTSGFRGHLFSNKPSFSWNMWMINFAQQENTWNLSTYNWKCTSSQTNVQILSPINHRVHQVASTLHCAPDDFHTFCGGDDDAESTQLLS